MALACVYGGGECSGCLRCQPPYAEPAPPPISKGEMRVDAKQYFENIRRIDKRIRDKQELYEHYRFIVERARDRADAETLGKLTRLESELKEDIDALCQKREIARSAMRHLQDERLREVVELRFFRGYSWVKIAQDMRYDRSYVWRLNARALTLLEEWLPECGGNIHAAI